ncbi:unnamed protein product [Leuciscus chuanchicus]
MLSLLSSVFKTRVSLLQLIGVRIPDHPFIRRLCQMCGEPLAITSANVSAHTSTVAASEFEDLWPSLAVVVDGGPIGDQNRLGSTVVDLSVKAKKNKGIYAFLRRVGKAIELPTLGCSEVDIVPYCDPTDVKQDLSGFDWAASVDPCPSGVELPVNADPYDSETSLVSGESLMELMSVSDVSSFEMSPESDPSVLDPESAPDVELISVSGQEGHGTDTAATKAVQCFQVFNHDVWPETVEELVDYGIEEVHFLLDHFKVVLERNGCDFALAEEEFQTLKTLVFMSFKDKSYHGLWEVLLTKEPYCSDLQNILHLVRIMLILPVSAAQCERGFSVQKRIKSDIRSSLHPKTVEDLIRISVEGPPLEAFDASASVKR